MSAHRSPAHRRAAVASLAAAGLGAWLLPHPARAAGDVPQALPPPPAPGPPGALFAALAARRSTRRFAPERPLTMSQLGALLWAAQGLTHGDGLRTTPSAGALHPLSLQVQARRVDGLAPGLYRYVPSGHRLARIADGPSPPGERRAPDGQGWVADAAALLLVAADEGRTAARYGDRAARYVAIEAGAAAQDVALAAAALGLGTVVVGAFDDEALARAWGLARALRPLLLMPVGVPAPGA